MNIILQSDTEAWLQARLGKVTASRVADVMARTKSGYGASRANYMAELIAERLTGVPAERYTNAAMQWGNEKEPEARAAYEFYANVTVAAGGFVDHPSIAMCGASPDGFIGDDGLLEIKCPNTSTHLETLLGEEIPEKYIKQMQWQMACTGRKWCDFVSYDPRMPGEMAVHRSRVPRNGTMIAELEREVRAFLTELDAKMAALHAKYCEAA